MADLLVNIKNDDTISADNDSERLGTRRGHTESHIEIPIRSLQAASSRIRRKVRFEDAVPCSLTGTLEYPNRIPLAPPLLVELQERPTKKYEGSQNFVSRLRPRTVEQCIPTARSYSLAESGITSPCTSLLLLVCIVFDGKY
jgi:hypothetical protein